MASIRLALGREARHARLLRNNRGHGWVGELVHKDEGVVILRRARPIEFGLCNGAGDLIGWSSRLITPDMVGQTIGVFTSGEVKFGKRRPSEDQEKWHANVVAAGGYSGVLRCEQDAIDLAWGRLK
jgi:hypothetical protein